MTDGQIKTRMEEVITQVLILLPKEQREAARNGLYIAGGAIVSLILDEQPVDYDVFLETQELASQFKEACGTAAPLDAGAELLANTENGLTWKLKTGEVLQVVTRFTGPPSRVFESFDFTHCKCYFVPERWFGALQETMPAELVYDGEVIRGKKLVYDGKKDRYCLNTLKRALKFTRRGWRSDNESILNLYRNIQKSPSILDPEEHRSQTVGYYGSSID